MPDYQKTGRNEVLFNGRPIEHYHYHGDGPDNLMWGYNGAGPTSTARSILEHATSEVDHEFSTEPREAMIDFRRKYIASVGKTEEWTIDLREVIDFLRRY